MKVPVIAGFSGEQSPWIKIYPKSLTAPIRSASILPIIWTLRRASASYPRAKVSLSQHVSICTRFQTPSRASTCFTQRSWLTRKLLRKPGAGLVLQLRTFSNAVACLWTRAKSLQIVYPSTWKDCLIQLQVRVLVRFNLGRRNYVFVALLRLFSSFSQGMLWNIIKFSIFHFILNFFHSIFHIFSILFISETLNFIPCKF